MSARYTNPGQMVFTDQRRRAGIAVDVQTVDWSSIITRRNTRASPVDNTLGWDIAFTIWGGISLASPLTNTSLVSRCDGKTCMAAFVTKHFLDSITDTAQREVTKALQRQYFDVAP